MSEPRKKRIMFLSNISIIVKLLSANAKNKKMKRLLNGYILLTNSDIIKNRYIPVHLAHKMNWKPKIKNERSGFWWQMMLKKLNRVSKITFSLFWIVIEFKYSNLGYSKIGFILWQVKNSTYTYEYQNFLRNLKRARKDSGLTQVEVAQKLNQPQSYISKCESGEKRVDVIELLRFAKIYNKQLEFFVQDISVYK